ncbi:chlorophyll synthase ChlG [Palleronia caenipelagi]|uniref:Chlorophyll synthase ChlG n=1 Tax=Palleronia caenipelagi TaxID=2489174 RepID=A0A547Q7N2_9RHOB|nr:chlorophyll synthase ChlG [Palleronia caenipelagi]TRD22384.1 chlorophyll synthase ChlG [Palleronia caenipelagi]
MSVHFELHPDRSLPEPTALLRLIKPITWFPPMWALLCGAISSGAPLLPNWALVAVGLILAGPLICGMSQATNDWFDRHVDAINEPDRPIPSGRVPGRWGLYIAIAMTLAGLAVGATLGPWGFGATVVAAVAAWVYSAPPLRAKQDGFWGTLLVAISYEGLPWFTGAAILSAGAPSFFVIVIATLYAFGAQGIMILNDFKAIEGDRQMGIRSLPVIKGPLVAGRMACTMMILPQFLVIMMLMIWDRSLYALAINGLVAVQILMMRHFLKDPTGRALWLSGLGVPFYVSGMMIAAFAIRGLTL